MFLEHQGQLINQCNTLWSMNQSNSFPETFRFAQAKESGKPQESALHTDS